MLWIAILYTIRLLENTRGQIWIVSFVECGKNEKGSLLYGENHGNPFLSGITRTQEVAVVVRKHSPLSKMGDNFRRIQIKENRSTLGENMDGALNRCGGFL
jgi:hypothetical protein